MAGVIWRTGGRKKIVEDLQKMLHKEKLKDETLAVAVSQRVTDALRPPLRILSVDPLILKPNGGTTVRICGTGFAEPACVYFNGKSVQAKVEGACLMTAKSPELKNGDAVTVAVEIQNMAAGQTNPSVHFSKLLQCAELKVGAPELDRKNGLIRISIDIAGTLPGLSVSVGGKTRRLVGLAVALPQEEIAGLKTGEVLPIGVEACGQSANETLKVT
jgi:hypothetical protein